MSGVESDSADGRITNPFARSVINAFQMGIEEDLLETLRKHQRVCPFFIKRESECEKGADVNMLLSIYPSLKQQDLVNIMNGLSGKVHSSIYISFILLATR